jgi:hypothetical protein
VIENLRSRETPVTADRDADLSRAILMGTSFIGANLSGAPLDSQGTGYCRLSCRRFDRYPSGMGPNRRAQERERAAAEAAAKAKRAEAERRAVSEAQKIVAIWNARQAGGRELWFYPTIGAAIKAGLPWLSFSCPACGQVGSVDLRTLDQHPRASISSLIPSVSCRRCLPNAPFARLTMLTTGCP